MDRRSSRASRKKLVDPEKADGGRLKLLPLYITRLYRALEGAADRSLSLTYGWLPYLSLTTKRSGANRKLVPAGEKSMELGGFRPPTAWVRSV
jgi:hypothetical protein